MAKQKSSHEFNELRKAAEKITDRKEADKQTVQDPVREGRDLFSGGEMGAFISSMDWSATPLGPRDTWPESLHTVVNLILANSFPMAILWGSDLIFIYNDAYRVIAGDRHPNAMGRSTREIWPEVWDFNKPVFQRVMSRGETVHFEDQLFPIVRNGRMEDAYFTLSYSPIFLEADHVGGTLVVLVETTRKKHAEKQLEAAHKGLEKKVEKRTARLRAEVIERQRMEAEARRLLAAVQEEKDRLSALVNSIQDEVWFADTNKKFTLANPSALREFHFGTVDSIDVEKMAAGLEVYRPDGTARPVDEAPPLLSLKGEVVRNQEEIIRTPANDALRYREVSSAPVRDAAGSIVGSVSVVRDITERKRIEDELAAAQRQVQSIIDNTTALIYAFDLEERFLLANTSVAELLNSTPEQMIGKRRHEFMPKDDADWHEANDRRVIEAGKALEFEEYGQLKGRSITWLTTKFPLRDTQGRIYAVAGISTDVSERKKAEEALRESEERLALAASATRIGMFDWNLTKGSVFWTRTVDSIFGYVPTTTAAATTVTTVTTEYDYGRWADRVHPYDLPLIDEESRRCIKDRQPFEMQYRIIWPDGSLHWIETRGVFQYDSDGNANRMLGVVMDITERKRAENRLSADLTALTRMHELSTKVLEVGGLEPLLQEIMDAAVAIVSAEKGTLQLVEGDCLRIVAHHGHERPFLHFFASADNVASVCGEATKRGERVVVEDVETSALFAGTPSLPVLRAAGVRTVQSTPLLSRHGELLGILTTHWRVPYVPDEHDLWRIDLLARQAADMIEHTRAEEALRRSRDELDLRVQERTEALRRQADLLELAHSAIIARDLESRITFWNHGAERVYGWTKAEALGNFTHTFLKTRFPVSLDEYMASLTKEGRWEGELEHTTKDGRNITVLSRQALQRDEAGNPAAILEINLDITEARRTEQQLRQAQKMEALGTLTGGVAHDFNNILAAIIGFTELVKDHIPQGSREAHHLKRVMEAAIRGRELVRQMLTYSRKTEQERKPLSLSSIVEETVKLIRAATPTTITIKVDTLRESGVILADPTQMQQVVMNLCTNAAHAMLEKGGTLDIQLGNHLVSPSNGDPHGLNPGLYTRLTVRDTGTGMSPDIVDKIFDPFFTTKKLGEGTGLGLSVVYGIVKQSNGHITVESEPGRGSTFTLYFPQIAGELKADATTDDMLPTGTESVLFIDDEEALVETGEDILAELGYDVTCRTSSAEALALFRADPSRFDLVITDQTMPEMTGFELAKQVLAIRADMPIIMCTGFSYVVNEDKAKAAGIKAFAIKPLTKREVAQTIRKVLEE